MSFPLKTNSIYILSAFFICRLFLKKLIKLVSTLIDIFLFVGIENPSYLPAIVLRQISLERLYSLLLFAQIPYQTSVALIEFPLSESMKSMKEGCNPVFRGDIASK